MFILTTIYFILSDLEVFTVLFSVSLAFNITALVGDIIFYTPKRGFLVFKWSPNYLYDITKMNRASCKIFGVLAYTILDAYIIVMYVSKFIYYITHVGRED